MSIFTKKGDLHVKDYMAALRRRWKIIVAVFLCSLLGSLYVNYVTPPLYLAKATLVINPDLPQSMLGPVNAYVAEMNEDVSIGTQLWIIRSDPIAAGVVRRLNLIDEEKNPIAFRDFVSNVRRNILVERIMGTRLFEIQARSNKGQEAADVANIAAEVFIEQSLQSRFDASRRSISWLTEQIIQMRKKLEESEQAMLDYQKKENIASSGLHSEFQTQKMSDLQGQYIDNQTRVSETKSKIAQIHALLNAKEVRFVPNNLSGSLDELSRLLTVAELNLEKAKIQYKGKHPRIVQLMGEISVIQDQMRNELKKVVKNLESEYQIAQAKEKVLGQALEAINKTALEGDEKQVQLTIIKREIDTYRELYNLLIKKLKAADLTRGIGESNFRIIEYAKNPRWPIQPRKNRNVFFGLVVGAVLGFAVAFGVEYLDRTIRTPEDIEDALGLPVLVSIPRVKGGQKEKQESIFLSAENQQSPEAEAFHALRTNLRFAQDRQSINNLLITSTSPSEGKTTISINLGISFANSGAKTLIVDTDLRKPRVHTVFGCPNDRGVSNCVEGNLQHYVQKTNFPNLEILTSGPHTSAPFEILESERMRKLVRKLKESYDIVIFDSAPIGSVVDASVLATYVDGVIFVLQSGRVEALHLKHAVEQLEKVQAPVLGVVLNGLERDASRYYYSYYYRGYYGDKAKDILKGIKDSVKRV